MDMKENLATYKDILQICFDVQGGDLEADEAAGMLLNIVSDTADLVAEKLLAKHND